jgi:hypothetical protein
MVAVHDLLLDGWFKPFCLFNLYTTPSFLAVVEIFFLNAIRCQVVSKGTAAVAIDSPLTINSSHSRSRVTFSPSSSLQLFTSAGPLSAR